METDIYLLAHLFSVRRHFQLEKFLHARSFIRQGNSLRSKEFALQFPDIIAVLRKWNQQEILRIESMFQRTLEQGGELVYPGHPQYPLAFLKMGDPPFLLYIRGTPVWLHRAGLAVVGSREPSQQSVDWLELYLADFLRMNSQAMIVSGGARGIDQQAHRISLRAGAPTVVFLPSGYHQLYPPGLKDLVPYVLSGGGAVISEYEDQTEMRKHFFNQRNRLISALGVASLIVEAGRKSGTLLTARQSLEQGKPVWVVPGHPSDRGMQGSLDLLIDGATPLRDAEDLHILFASEKGSAYQVDLGDALSLGG